MRMSRGVLVGTDTAQEWLLPWWWSHYSCHNTLPVTFVDFGMSQKVLHWCQKKGNVIPLHLDKSFIAPKEAIDPTKAAIWERRAGKDVWGWRESCFNKPFALALTPYDETVWLDLDCEVFESLDPIFQFIKEFDFSIANPMERFEEQYNSGVVVYRKNSAILEKWIDLCLRENVHFYGDDHVLSHLLNHEEIPFQLLPREWNWMMPLGINFFVKIFHWLTPVGKAFIKAHGGIQSSKRIL